MKSGLVCASRPIVSRSVSSAAGDRGGNSSYDRVGSACPARAASSSERMVMAWETIRVPRPDAPTSYPQVSPSRGRRVGGQGQTGRMITETNDLTRCFGAGDPLYEEYHDKEWGVPVHG